MEPWKAFIRWFIVGMGSRIHTLSPASKKSEPHQREPHRDSRDKTGHKKRPDRFFPPPHQYNHGNTGWIRIPVPLMQPQWQSLVQASIHCCFMAGIMIFSNGCRNRQIDAPTPLKKRWLKPTVHIPIPPVSSRQGHGRGEPGGPKSLRYSIKSRLAKIEKRIARRENMSRP